MSDQLSNNVSVMIPLPDHLPLEKQSFDGEYLLSSASFIILNSFILMVKKAMLIL